MFPFAPTFMLGGGEDADEAAEEANPGPPGAQRAVGLRFFSRTFFSRLVMMSTAELRMASFVQGLALASSFVLGGFRLAQILPSSFNMKNVISMNQFQ